MNDITQFDSYHHTLKMGLFRLLRLLKNLSGTDISQLVLEFYAGLVFHRVRLTNYLVEIISSSDVLKDSNFNLC